MKYAAVLTSDSGSDPPAGGGSLSWNAEQTYDFVVEDSSSITVMYFLNLVSDLVNLSRINKN